MFTRTLFCTENNLPLFPRPMKTLLRLRMTKFDFCNSLSFAFYSHNWQTTRFRDNWQFNVHKNFILYWKQLCHYFQYENTVMLRMTKAKIRLLQILLVYSALQLTKQQDLGDNWQINVHKNFILYLKWRTKKTHKDTDNFLVTVGDGIQLKLNEGW
jgi:hypothetical protein